MFYPVTTLHGVSLRLCTFSFSSKLRKTMIPTKKNYIIWATSFRFTRVSCQRLHGYRVNSLFFEILHQPTISIKPYLHCLARRVARTSTVVASLPLWIGLYYSHLTWYEIMPWNGDAWVSWPATGLINAQCMAPPVNLSLPLYSP